MRTSIRLMLFAEAVAFVFLAAVGLGAAVGSPVEPAAHDAHGAAAGAHGTATQRSGAASGLQVAEAGYTLRDVTAPRVTGEAGTLNFELAGPDGRPLTAYDVVHDKQMHLVVVRRDTTSFRHVHPTLGADGTWSIPWTWAQAGSYRVFADFDPAGDQGQLTLGTDVQVAGAYEPQDLPATSRTAEVDGYTVTLDGDLSVGAAQPLTFSVSRDGRPVTDLEPYLGAYGHLVALRAGDLAYLHVHPDGEPGDGATSPGPRVTFVAEAPSAATYRLFLDFQHDGTVRTAEFTVETAPDAALSDHAH